MLRACCAPGPLAGPCCAPCYNRAMTVLRACCAPGPPAGPCCAPCCAPGPPAAPRCALCCDRAALVLRSCCARAAPSRSYVASVAHPEQLLIVCALGSGRGCPGSTCISSVWLERCNAFSLSLSVALRTLVRSWALLLGRASHPAARFALLLRSCCWAGWAVLRACCVQEESQAYRWGESRSCHVHHGP